MPRLTSRSAELPDSPATEGEGGAARARIARRQLSPACRASIYGAPGESREVHLFVEPESDGSFEEQLRQVAEAYAEALKTLGLARHTAVFRRLFVSDAANQLQALMDSPLGIAVPDAEAAAVSCIEQPPLCFRKLALQAYHVSDVTPEHKHLEVLDGAGPHARNLTLSRGEQQWLWTAQMTGERRPYEPLDAYPQTRRLFGRYTKLLREHQANLLGNAVRTWVFVQNVDTHYAGMVASRRELFLAEGLSPKSHYIVSTGIEGRTASPTGLVTMDAVALTGLADGQMVYIDCLDHLNRTDDYGVTFERAVRLDHADRSHLYLAGTASIDSAGRILHEGDIIGQVGRTMENIRALLEVGGADLDDMAAMIVYLRDAADTRRAKEFLDERYPTLPFTAVQAPVCRPGWLVEIEGLAILPHHDPRWPRF